MFQKKVLDLIPFFKIFITSKVFVNKGLWIFCDFFQKTFQKSIVVQENGCRFAARNDKGRWGKKVRRGYVH